MKKLLLIFIISLLSSSMLFASGEGESGKEKLVFGVTLETFDDVFIAAVKDEIKKTADEMGITVVITDSKSDPAEQVKQVDNFISSGVDAIIVHVINNDIALILTDKAVVAGMPLVYMNRNPGSSSIPLGEKVAAVASSEIEAGRGQAKYVVDKLGKKGNAVILLGGVGSISQIGRTQGIEEYLAENAPDFKVIRKQTANWKRPDAIQVVENWLASSDKINVVFANNDEMAIGASLALKERGLKDSVIVVGVDASPDGISALEVGDIDMTMFQNGRAQGKGSVEVAVKMAKGESFDQNVSIPFEPVTKENASQYK